MTFSEGSPFHIIVTSYQLVRIPSFPLPSSPFLFACLILSNLAWSPRSPLFVFCIISCFTSTRTIANDQAVQDEKYFQGMKWQYMILDEAQAIKSSSSNRWRSLLSLQCRNRLLLTGTPIQNSMQGESNHPSMGQRVDKGWWQNSGLYSTSSCLPYSTLMKSSLSGSRKISKMLLEVVVDPSNQSSLDDCTWS